MASMEGGKVDYDYEDQENNNNNDYNDDVDTVDKDDEELNQSQQLHYWQREKKTRRKSLLQRTSETFTSSFQSVFSFVTDAFSADDDDNEHNNDSQSDSFLSESDDCSDNSFNKQHKQHQQQQNQQNQQNQQSDFEVSSSSSSSSDASVQSGASLVFEKEDYRGNNSNHNKKSTSASVSVASISQHSIHSLGTATATSSSLHSSKKSSSFFGMSSRAIANKRNSVNTITSNNSVNTNNKGRRIPQQSRKGSKLGTTSCSTGSSNDSFYAASTDSNSVITKNNNSTEKSHTSSFVSSSTSSSANGRNKNRRGSADYRSNNHHYNNNNRHSTQDSVAVSHDEHASNNNNSNSNTSAGNNSTNNNTNNTNVVDYETKQVQKWHRIVKLFLFNIGILLCYTMYIVVYHQRKYYINSALQQYQISVQSIEITINQHIHQMVLTTQGLSRSITSHGKFLMEQQQEQQQQQSILLQQQKRHRQRQRQRQLIVQDSDEERRHGSYDYNDYNDYNTINTIDNTTINTIDNTTINTIDNTTNNTIDNTTINTIDNTTNTTTLEYNNTDNSIIDNNNYSYSSDNIRYPFVAFEQTFEFFASEVRVDNNNNNNNSNKKGMYSRLWYTPIVNVTDYIQWINFSLSHSSWPIESMSILQQQTENSAVDVDDKTTQYYYEMFSQPIQSQIYNYEPINPLSTSGTSSSPTSIDNLTVWDPESNTDEIFLPILYISPPPVVPATTFPYMNLNCFTDKTLKDLSSVSSTLGKVVVSSMTDTMNNPETIVSIPIYSDLMSLRGNIMEGGNTTVVAYVFAVIAWKKEMINIIKESSASATTHESESSQPYMVLVLKNTCGQSLLYELHVDSSLHFIGDGNNIIYDKTYESYKTTIMITKDYVPLVPLSAISTIANSTNHNSSTAYDTIDCQYYIELYPSVQYVQSYRTIVPFIFTVLSCLMFTITVILFVLYDRFVSINNEKAVAAAARSIALVSSLFPSNVRERLLQEKEDEAVEQQLLRKQRGKQRIRNIRSFITGNGPNHDHQDFGVASQHHQLQVSEHQLLPNQRQQRRISIHGVTSNNNNNNQNSTVFNNGSNDGSNNVLDDVINTDATGIEIYKSKPIADFFPEATVLFGDIVGFTAWSSVREPTQVFTLLETVYHAFDDIARRRRVFKVETVGDCYVAVCGLPDPRKDHAVTMCRFARDCMYRMWALVKKLETTLGPDTSDLTMRMGLHSGPVTAGVLRGERSRFQLFGDTVNTAARMEHNGLKSKIQISDTTANILFESGKRSWVTIRDEKILAKGKGEMQTYWLELGGGNSNAPPEATTGFTSYTMDVCDQIKKMVNDVESSNNGPDEAPVIESRQETKPVCSDKVLRLVGWNVEVLLRLIKQIVARRQASIRRSKSLPIANEETITQGIFGTDMVLDEVKEIIELPQFDAKAAKNQLDIDSIELDARVPMQLEEYVMTIGSGYRENPFHNFEHAAHVTMSVVKLLSRIVAPSQHYAEEGGAPAYADDASSLHDHTYGITSDPLTQFSCVLSALIHDLDHPGVPNAQLVKESTPLAEHYKCKSVAEQNSVDMAWTLLMQPRYKELRAAIYTTEIELRRFRQLVVNSVMATDIVDKELKGLRNARWDKAFSQDDDAKLENVHDQINRKATIVIEHLIQASDVAHTMQHWHIYRKWNERFFTECYHAYKTGRAETDPSINWYQGEIGFFDFYIIPLAKKLKNCGVFGVSCDEYLNYALKNRKEWEERGQDIVHEMTEKVKGSM